ncbi:MAG: adenine deaminase [Dehalococcoidales bacterium]
MSREHLISVARGLQPADLVLANARVINVFSGEIETASVALSEGLIAGVGDYREAADVWDLRGKYLVPGLINGHTHLESSMLSPGQYARAVVPRGTLAVVTDLHEIANVCGMDGIRYVMDCARRLPVEFFLMAPSCVPATSLETSGAVIGIGEIKKLLRLRHCIGLGEVMNYPGVLAGDSEVLRKIALAERSNVDGHCPALSGPGLNAYIGAGIGSDHESVSPDEGREKLRRGMYLMIREGSTEKNLDALLPLVNDRTYPRCIFVVDDRSCADLLGDGDIDAVVRKAIMRGLEPVRAIQMATINAAVYFRLKGLGAVAPGYRANLMVCESLRDLRADMVFHRGRLVARDGEPLFDVPEVTKKEILRTVNIGAFTPESLRLFPAADKEPVIDIVPYQITTRKRMEVPRTRDGLVVADTERDILKLAVVERHCASGNVGLGMVRGFGLKRGALASSVAHDSHNVISVGTSDEDMYCAIKEVESLEGGLVVACGGRVMASLALPVAGLLSGENPWRVAEEIEVLQKMAIEMGCGLADPFAALSFLALPVIPEIRLTDLGMVDVNEFRLIKRGE